MTLSSYLSRVIFGCLGLLAFSACGPKADPNAETATNGTFELVADEALRPAIDSLIIGFSSENPSAHITVRYESATEAMLDFINKKARLVIISRNASPREWDVMKTAAPGVEPIDLAQDAVAIIVNKAVPIDATAMSDLREIVNSKESHWGEQHHSHYDKSLADRQGEKVMRVLGPYTSSAESLLDSLFLPTDSTQTGLLKRFTTTDSVIAAVRNNKGAIGFIGSAWKHQLMAQGDSSVKLLSIIPSDSSSTGINKPIMHHLAYIYEGVYPLTNRVNAFTTEASNSLPRGFLAYAATAHGQLVFKNFEILPHTQIIKIVPTRK